MPSDRVSQYGLDPESRRVNDVTLLRHFVEDHPEWDGHAGRVLSWESSIRAWDEGADTPDHWTGVTIIGVDDGSDEGDWAIEITQDDGSVVVVALAEYYDLAWDFYDAAGYYGYDVEKDIDTGGPE